MTNTKINFTIVRAIIIFYWVKDLSDFEVHEPVKFFGRSAVDVWNISVDLNFGWKRIRILQGGVTLFVLVPLGDGHGVLQKIAVHKLVKFLVRQFNGFIIFPVLKNIEGLNVLRVHVRDALRNDRIDGLRGAINTLCYC